MWWSLPMEQWQWGCKGWHSPPSQGLILPVAHSMYFCALCALVIVWNVFLEELNWHFLQIESWTPRIPMRDHSQWSVIMMHSDGEPLSHIPNREEGHKALTELCDSYNDSSTAYLVLTLMTPYEKSSRRVLSEAFRKYSVEVVTALWKEVPRELVRSEYVLPHQGPRTLEPREQSEDRG